LKNLKNWKIINPAKFIQELLDIWDQFNNGIWESNKSLKKERNTK